MMYLKNCGVCKRFFFSQRGLCQRCEEQLYSQKINRHLKSPRQVIHKQKNKALPHQYLFNWKENDFFLQQFHIYIKTEKNFENSEWIRAGFIRPPALSCIFLCVPGSVVSLRLAQHLGQRFEIPVLDILEWVCKLGPHKQLSREDRLKSRMKVKEGATVAQTHALSPTYILIDDVVTTGSTAFCAYEALSRPRHFEVWSLSCRD